MRYWSYLAAKLAGAAGLLYALKSAIDWWFPQPPPSRFGPSPLFLRDLPFTFTMLGLWLFGIGLVYLIILDQRYRCRTCLRRLRMPIVTGSWTHILMIGRPKIEYICTYGHGTLKISELHISGTELADWEPHDDDIWKELESLENSKR